MFIGIHAKYIPKTANLETGIIWNYASQLIYNPILAIAKCSVLVFLLRLGGHKRRIRWSIYALLAWTSLQMLATFIVVVFQCQPISYFWTRVYVLNGGVCIDTAVFCQSSPFIPLPTLLAYGSFAAYLQVGKSGHRLELEAHVFSHLFSVGPSLRSRAWRSIEHVLEAELLTGL